MKIYSEEYLEQLSYEYKLVSTTLARLQSDLTYRQSYQYETISGAVSNLMAEKCILEAKIDAITEFLNG